MATFESKSTSILVSSDKPKTKEEKLEIIKSTSLKLEKQWGKGAIQTLGMRSEIVYPHISTGILTLDIVLGIGGLPKGRIIEIFGPEGGGKTSTSLSIIAQAQREGHLCAIVDAEHALDPAWASKLGVNVDELTIAQPDYGEQGLEILKELVDTGVFGVIVVDSVAALVPKAEIDGEMSDQQMGLHARLMSKAMRKLTASISQTNTIVIFINQIREKIGCVAPETKVKWMKKSA
jgi:recombination protein RecA